MRMPRALCCVLTPRCAAAAVLRCAACSCPPDTPFRGACNHVCCWRCWGAASRVCPRCGVQSRKQELQRLFFV